jgi:hypothetical protein
MTWTDYLFDSLLVLLVLRQLKESRLDTKSVVLPLAIIGWVVKSYLHTIPTGANDLLLIAGLTLVGMTCGLVSALGTRVRTDGGKHALIKAGPIAAGVWVLSMGGRFAFAVWASHGGGPQLYRFTFGHHLDMTVWTAALILMALGEVVSRTAILYLRAQRALARRSAKPAAAQLSAV